MLKSILVSSLFLLLLSSVTPVIADQYDDCLGGCQQPVASCVEQARLNAGNVQEEDVTIAACEKSKNDCIKACSDAEAQPQAPQQEQSKDQ